MKRKTHDAPFLLELLDRSPGLVVLIDDALNVSWVNEAAGRLFGYTPEEAIGRPLLEFLDPDWNPAAFESILTALGGHGLRAPMTFRVVSKDGTRTIIEAQANVQFENETLQGLVAYARPWTERWLLDEVLDAMAANRPPAVSLELLVQVAGSDTMAAQASLLYDPSGNRVRGAISAPGLALPLAGPTTDVSPECVQGWTALLAEPHGRVHHVADLPAALRNPAVSSNFESLWIWPSEHDVGHPARAWAVAWRDQPHLDADETRINLMARLATLAGLIVERSHADAARNHAATHDPLTGLRNRSGFFGELERELCRDEVQVGVLYLDLDKFKPINDEYGHSAGDRVLREVARRLAAAMPAGMTVSRLGGDEFAVVARDVSTLQLEALGHRLVAAVKQPIALRDDELVTVGASAGVAVSVDRNSDPQELIDAADRALYVAKQQNATVAIGRVTPASRTIE